MGKLRPKARRRIWKLGLGRRLFTAIKLTCERAPDWRFTRLAHEWATMQLLRRRMQRAQRVVARWWFRQRRKAPRREDALMATALVRPYAHFACGDSVMHVNVHTIWRCLLLNGKFENPFTREVVSRADTIRWQHCLRGWNANLPDLTSAFDHRAELRSAFDVMRSCCDETAFSLAHELDRPLAAARDAVERQVALGPGALTSACSWAIRALSHTLRGIHARTGRSSVLDAKRTILAICGYRIGSHAVRRPRDMVVEAWRNMASVLRVTITDCSEYSDTEQALLHSKLMLCLWREWHPPQLASALGWFTL